ncbi:hypothetical protein V1H85_17175 [Maribacter flavus]|uniref:Uncharacterized protein n=1 Tax=Maribacter flavus TaxID=1658664 RepID=A0ABU7INE8_9FLAO|nr:hypothetical protein [Maribacter sp. PR66]MEE1974193.1 hypothetical protein [Maribacter flavus]
MAKFNFGGSPLTILQKIGLGKEKGEYVGSLSLRLRSVTALRYHIL